MFNERVCCLAGSARRVHAFISFLFLKLTPFFIPTFLGRHMRVCAEMDANIRGKLVRMTFTFTADNARRTHKGSIGQRIIFQINAVRPKNSRSASLIFVLFAMPLSFFVSFLGNERVMFRQRFGAGIYTSNYPAEDSCCTFIALNFWHMAESSAS